VPHQVQRRAHLLELDVDVGHQGGARLQSFGRRGDDHRVAALQGIDDLVGGRGGGIGGRRDRRHHAHGAGDLDQTTPRVFGDDADAPRALQVAQQAERLAVVLLDLVVDVTQPRIAHRHLGQGAIALRVHDRPAGGRHRFVDLLLIGLLVDALCFPSAAHQLRHRLSGRVWV
jgi:hypothetical protein